MNDDFIVWDKDLKIFEEIKTDSDKSFLGKYLINKNRFETFQAIGLKDINGKNIYADSSIVEFNFYEYDATETEEKYFFNLLSYKKQTYDFVKRGKAVVIFTWDIKELCYNIRFIGGGLFPYYAFFNKQYRAKDFKIIDTIQENKLGLIK